MKQFKYVSLLILLLGGIFFTTSFTSDSDTTRYKCMLQTINYDGEGAYIIVSLMNPEGKYDHTLFIVGEDGEYYHLIDEWWSYFGKKERNIDGMTGATVGGGERKVISFEIDNDKIDKGYKIRFETSVEDQKYYPTDLEIPLTSKMPPSPQNGTGYLRYVRIMTQ